MFYIYRKVIFSQTSSLFGRVSQREALMNQSAECKLEVMGGYICVYLKVTQNDTAEVSN